MNAPDLPRQLVLRLAFVCVAAITARVVLLGPAHAGLESAKQNLAAQRSEAAALDEDAMRASSENADRVVKVCSRLEKRLRQPSGSNWMNSQIESAAARHGVQIFRTAPRGASKLDPPYEQEGPSLVSERYTVELAGPYGAVAALLAELDEDLGLIDVENARIGPTGPDDITATIDIAVFHLEKGATLVAAPEDHDDH